MVHRFPYNWKLSDTIFRGNCGKVFSCFSGVGGSSLGYKLAGFDVLGFNEIDEKMAECYIVNNGPKYRYIESIRDLTKRVDLPEELYELDILDGSPPCSSFSMSGNRERDWGKKKKFAEGQSEQVLDTLFFDFIDLVGRLRPKVAVAENVPAILLGNAIRYVHRIYREFKDVGYCLQHFVLDSSRMGVPQRRRRIFFVALRNDLSKQFLVDDGLLRTKPELKLEWNEPSIRFGHIRSEVGRQEMTNGLKKLLKYRIKSDCSLADINMRLYGKLSGFNIRVVRDHHVCPTMPASGYIFIRDCDSKHLSKYDIIRVSTFPSDFDFCDVNVQYACGMSVPPVMMAQVAFEIYRQWLSKIK
jgi:DNA (cytosine-5)-methyltransferase 1